MGMQPCSSTASWNCRSLFSPGTHHLVVQGEDLPPADQITNLVERLGVDEAPHLAVVPSSRAPRDRSET